MEFSPHHLKRSRTHLKCCVPGCVSSSKCNKNLSFHSIPRKNVLDLRELWLKKIRAPNKNLDQQKVCSLHFKADDYYFPGKLVSKLLHSYF